MTETKANIEDKTVCLAQWSELVGTLVGFLLDDESISVVLRIGNDLCRLSYKNDSPEGILLRKQLQGVEKGLEIRILRTDVEKKETLLTTIEKEPRCGTIKERIW